MPLFTSLSHRRLLLILQTVTIAFASIPLYYLTIHHLKTTNCLFVVVVFFLFTAVEYNNLFDFHPDHIFITLIFLCFYFLETNRKDGPFVAILSSFVKEPYLFGVAALGLYTAVRYKWYKTGIGVSLLSMAFFYSCKDNTRIIMEEQILELNHKAVVTLILAIASLA